MNWEPGNFVWLAGSMFGGIVRQFEMHLRKVHTLTFVRFILGVGGSLFTGLVAWQVFSVETTINLGIMQIYLPDWLPAATSLAGFFGPQTLFLLWDSVERRAVKGKSEKP